MLGSRFGDRERICKLHKLHLIEEGLELLLRRLGLPGAGDGDPERGPLGHVLCGKLVGNESGRWQMQRAKGDIVKTDIYTQYHKIDTYIDHALSVNKERNPLS